jgi:hypothetical protein
MFYFVSRVIFGLQRWNNGIPGRGIPREGEADDVMVEFHMCKPN